MIAVSAVRTGCGKSQTARYLSRLLRAAGRRVAVIRHPMPYGDLARQAVQRFAARADLDAAACTIEEREEYEPHLAAGNVVFAGVDYARIVAAGAGRGRPDPVGRRQQRLSLPAARICTSCWSIRCGPATWRAIIRARRCCAWPTSSSSPSAMPRRRQRWNRSPRRPVGTTGTRPVAIRALKRFVTDNVDPATYKPVRRMLRKDMPPVAVVGSGPAGLAAAHYLSLDGYKVTVYEADNKAGGMLVSGIPAYRLRRDVLDKEISSLIDDNIALKCDVALGRDFTIDNLFRQGFKAVFLALGAHKSRRLNIEGEDLTGVYPAIQYLKAFNLEGKKLARGYVAVIGGGNSAIDAARVALRQEGVTGVTILYRRTRLDMPALKEEIQSALQEGVKLETLVTPVKIQSKEGIVTGIDCVRNELTKMDASGRRTPVPIPGTEFSLPIDTLIVTIGDEPDIDYIASMGIESTAWGTLQVDPQTLVTSRAGVFAGGDVVTGPDTVVDAIAAGKKAAQMIGRYLAGEELKQPIAARRPQHYIEPCTLSEEALAEIRRAEPPLLPIELRRRSFSEVELCLSAEEAIRESKRCLRCDLEFTKPKQEDTPRLEIGAIPL